VNAGRQGGGRCVNCQRGLEIREDIPITPSHSQGGGGEGGMEEG
jgi:hypothetical protein